MLIEEYFKKINDNFDINSDEDMRIIYSKDNSFDYFSITKNSNNNSAEVFNLNRVIEILLTNNINEYYLCHNHPHGTPFLSMPDYKLIKKYYLVSKVLDIDLLNHYLLCNQNGIVGINLSNTYLQCVNNQGLIENKKNMYCDIECDNFINHIKNKYNYEIIIMKNDKTLNSIDKFLYKYLYEVANNSLINENQIVNYEKGTELTEYFPKRLNVFDNQLKDSQELSDYINNPYIK